MCATSYRQWNLLRLIGLGWVVGFLSVSGSALAESHAVSRLQLIPAGVTLPVQLGKRLSAGKTKPGTVFVVTTTQRIPLSEDWYLDRGAKLRGEVMISTAGDGTVDHPSVLTIRFTELSYRGQSVPVMTRAVAIANLMAVDDTFLPANGSTDRGNSNQASWTTRQVGGDLVARSGWVGPVVGTGLRTVGSADFHGVYSLPVEIPNGTMVPLAMGVFSTTAEGLYSFDDGAQLNSANGLITITNRQRRAIIRNGDDLLLVVIPAR
jgi:hypothetical protein